MPRVRIGSRYPNVSVASTVLRDHLQGGGRPLPRGILRAMSQENVEIVRRGLKTLQEALERRDFESVFDADVLADDVEWIPSRSFPGPNSYRGRDGVSEYMRTWAEEFDHLSFDIEALIDAPDDRVVALVHQRASGQGSRVPVEMDLAAVYDLEDGRVIRIRNYLDPKEALEAAGLREQAMSEENGKMR